MNQITDRIWIGDSTDAQHANLAENGINAILNVAGDLQGVRGCNNGIHYAQCGLIDGPGNNLSAYYSAVLQLGNLIKLGKTVLVHCHAGWSRSPAVVACYLHAFDRRGWDHHMNMIAERRPQICPSKAHEEAFAQMDWYWLSSALGV